MWAMIRRTALPVLLLLGGGTLLAYGVKFHSLSVVAEEQVEQIVEIPSPFAIQPPFPGAPPDFPGPPPLLDEPPPIVEKVIATIRETKEKSEPTLIREVTVGGVALTREESTVSIFGVILLASGELKQTYSGEIPSLCPT